MVQSRLFFARLRVLLNVVVNSGFTFSVSGYNGQYVCVDTCVNHFYTRLRMCNECFSRTAPEQPRSPEPLIGGAQSPSCFRTALIGGAESPSGSQNALIGGA